MDVSSNCISSFIPRTRRLTEGKLGRLAKKPWVPFLSGPCARRSGLLLESPNPHHWRQKAFTNTEEESHRGPSWDVVIRSPGAGHPAHCPSGCCSHLPTSAQSLILTWHSTSSDGILWPESSSCPTIKMFHPLPNCTKSCLHESMNLKTLVGPGIWAGDEARIWVSDEAAYADLCLTFLVYTSMLLKLALLGLARLSKFPPSLCPHLWNMDRSCSHSRMLSARSMGLEMFKTLSSAVPLLWFQSLPLPKSWTILGKCTQALGQLIFSSMKAEPLHLSCRLFWKLN